jgi:class 3 adenylate cyclase
MNCPNCRTENPPPARFCLHCGAALALACAHCGAELPPAARFCMSCGRPVQARTATDEALHKRLAAATPPRLAEKARAAAALAGERRVVTVLFADVVGSTALAERAGDEAWLAIRNGALERIIPAIYQYEGTLARLLGDGLWAFFGAPVAHEDDPQRAVRAGLALLAAAAAYGDGVRRRYGLAFAMRACLNTGPVVIGPVGDDLRYEYTAVGGAVDLAARLKFVARPGTLLITENTRRFVDPLFETVAAGTVEVQGGAERVRTYEVIGARPEPGRLRGLAGLESPLVGRDAELSALLGLCEAVRAGLGRAVLLLGEPGVGKTRLIAEWKAAAAGMGHEPAPLWAEGRCLSHGQGLAYHLLTHLLRSFLGLAEPADESATCAALTAATEDLLGDEAETVAPYLGHLLALEPEGEAWQAVEGLDPQALQAQYLAAIRRLLLGVARRRPLVLVLEDLHWADPSSTELLIKLLPLASSSSILFCMAARPDREAPGWRLVTAARELMGGSLTEIHLAPLSETESRQLVANLLRVEALPEPVRSLILRRAEGNPLFVEEVIRMLIDRGAIRQRNGEWVAEPGVEAVEIPDNLQGLLLARIDRLPEEVKNTLRVAAVIGRQFPLRVLEAVLGEGEMP